MKIITKNLCLLPVLIALISCGGNGKSGKIKVDGIQSKVQRILSGNEIELKNGLKVVLLGIKPTEHTKSYLEAHVVGKNVTVIADSRQKQYIKTYMTKVKAYVKVKGDRYSVSGKLLLNKTAELCQTSVKDSLQVFIEHARRKERSVMTQSELLTYMKPATFEIIREDGGRGTGFFISDNGLALTNNHVLDGNQNAIICFFGEDGTLDETNYRKINRLLLTNEDSKIDFTVFLVQLDNNEKVRYMPLVEKHINDGEAIAKIGCPVGTVCNFQTGTLSNYNEGYFTHSISSNHGDSGRPIVNFRGEIVGINQSIEFNSALSNMTGTVQKAEGIAYGVDAVLIRRILDENNIQYGR